MTDLQTAPDIAPAAGRRMRSGLTSDEIRALLPHEWPFLFLDRVTEVRPPDRASGLKNVAVSEPYFAGHFRQQSVMPGALIIETLAQLGGVLLAVSSVEDGEAAGATGRTYLAGVQQMRFRRPVRPGDQLRLRVLREHSSNGITQMRAEAKVGADVAADGVLLLAT